MAEEGKRPFVGWRCTEIEDLLEPSEICDLCRIAEIRYVHVMMHAHWPEVLRVGEICAGHLAGDLTAARARNRAAEHRTANLKSWLRKDWRTSKRGNHWLPLAGHTLSVFFRNGEWVYCINWKGGNTFVGKFRSQNDAKIAAIKRLADMVASDEAGVDVRDVPFAAVAPSLPADDWWRDLLPSHPFGRRGR